jgi:hypothetical protein
VSGKSEFSAFAPNLNCGLELRPLHADDKTGEPVRTGAEPMANTTKPEQASESIPPDPYPDYPPIYGFVFQSWLIMCLAVICIALAFYLYSYIR